MILSLKTKNGENNIDEKWNNIKDSLTSAVAKTLGYGVKEKWIKSDTWILISEIKKIRSNNFHCKTTQRWNPGLIFTGTEIERSKGKQDEAEENVSKTVYVKPRKHPGLELSKNSIKSPN